MQVKKKKAMEGNMARQKRKTGMKHRTNKLNATRTHKLTRQWKKATSKLIIREQSNEHKYKQKCT